MALPTPHLFTRGGWYFVSSSIKLSFSFFLTGPGLINHSRTVVLFIKENSQWKFLCILAKTFLKLATEAKNLMCAFWTFFLFGQRLFERACFSSVREIWEALPQLHFLLKTISILKVLLFWPWIDFELNVVVISHVLNEVQVCPSTEFIPSEGFQVNTWLWEQPLTASSHLPLQFSNFFTSRKKHKQLIKVYTEMLDEEINNLSGCLKWQVQNKQGHGDTV